MYAIILDILPVFFVLLLGYLAGRWHQFSESDARTFNKLVFDFAMPALLFSSIVQSKRETIVSYLDMFVVAALVINIWFVVTVLIAMRVYRHDRRDAGLAGLMGSFGASGFLGIAMLGPVYGDIEAAISVALVALASNVIQVPIAMVLVAPPGSRALASALSAMKQPIVFVPLLAILLVIVGLEIPAEGIRMLGLIGSTASGVAIFAAGITISANPFVLNVETVWNTLAKMLILPALALVAGLAAGLGETQLNQLVILCALPSALTGVILASKLNTYVTTGASSLVLTFLLFVFTAPAWTYILSTMN